MKEEFSEITIVRCMACELEKNLGQHTLLNVTHAYPVKVIGYVSVPLNGKFVQITQDVFLCHKHYEEIK